MIAEIEETKKIIENQKKRPMNSFSQQIITNLLKENEMKLQDALELLEY